MQFCVSPNLEEMGDTELHDGVRIYKMKLGLKRLLNQGSEEARLAYKEAKMEAKSKVRKALNDEWIRLVKEMAKDAKWMEKFWSRVRPKKREIGTHMRGLDVELRSGHFDKIFDGNAGRRQGVMLIWQLASQLRI